MKVPTAVLPDTITIRPYEGQAAGGPIHGDPVSVRARVEGRRRAVRTGQGVDVIGTATAIIRPGPTVVAESLVEHDDQTYTVLEVSPGEGLRRPAYLELILDGPR